MAEVSLRNIHKVYDRGEQAITDFSLTIHDNEFMVFVGPSGCGKSTLLRMIAGLEKTTKGDILIDQQRVNDLPAKDRDISIVFQQFSLYPHMTVYNNLAFGLKRRKWHKDKIDRQIEHAARILQLTNYLDRKPASLSGGQQQRVALGRALVRNPKLFLMDEPLSNLDAKLRTDMRMEIKKVHAELGTTTVYVTHDQTEALTMADRIAVVKDGVIQQIGTPDEIYHKPNNMFVGGFLGSPPMNFISGVFQNGHFHMQVSSLPLPEQTANTLNAQGYKNKNVVIGIRPEHILTDPVTIASFPHNIVSLSVTDREMHGAAFILYGEMEGQSVLFRTSDALTGQEKIDAVLHSDFIHFFDPATEKRIF